MRKLTLLLMTLCLNVLGMQSQNKEWSSPFVGYSTTHVLTLDKVEFEKGKTLLHVTATTASGASISVSPNAYLSANGKHYAIQKVSVLGIGKQYAMPDSGKVHFTMQFAAVPAGTRLMHFSEGEVKSGWTLCNIRERQEDLVTKMPKEWKDVTYPDQEYLPDSYFSDDSTYIHVKILNYVPEVGTKLEIYELAYDVDKRYYSREYDISLDGTAIIGLHPAVPQSIYLRIGKGPYSFLVVMPGKDISALMDLGKGGTEPFVAFKGELAKANYEVNLKGAKDLYWFDNSDAHFESLLFSGKSLDDEWRLLRDKYSLDSIQRQYANSTKDWLYLYAKLRRMEHLLCFDRYVYLHMKDNQKDVNRLILKKDSVRNNIWTNIKKASQVISSSSQMTICPNFMSYIDGKCEYGEGEVNTFNKDILTLFWALNGYVAGSYNDGERWASLILDSTIRAYYPIATKRWNDYVIQLNRLPHIHFDQHGDVRTKEELKKKLLEDYRGKNVVFLVYDRDKHGIDLDELESDFISRANAQKVVFIHIDTRSPAMYGTGSWADAAVKRKGEHYGGERNRYDSMFSGHNPFFDGQFYYELYAPDGTCTLQTIDKKKAFNAIRKLVNK